METQTRLVYTVREAAIALGVAPYSVRQMVRRGELPLYLSAARRPWLIPAWAVDELLERLRKPGT
ncbi:protein of unknown function [Candidatus Hydrogenisulfobacillus filiaventi]|nr:helix-turn-helix domain-containing protein [Bacillota bacterium]CAB1129592.1 protein of unknown function [Candidatus Hydrogenisulfobacillus filiaventi]